MPLLREPRKESARKIFVEEIYNMKLIFLFVLVIVFAQEDRKDDWISPDELPKIQSPAIGESWISPDEIPKFESKPGWVSPDELPKDEKVVEISIKRPELINKQGKEWISPDELPKGTNGWISPEVDIQQTPSTGITSFDAEAPTFDVSIIWKVGLSIGAFSSITCFCVLVLCILACVIPKKKKKEESYQKFVVIKEKLGQDIKF